jgi:methionyl-tRNA formyltransferase
VSLAAEQTRIPLLRPEHVGATECVEALRESNSDLGVVVAFGQFLPRPVREFPHLGYLINAHASLLPRHRGAAPIARAILCGDEQTGISIMRVEREMDAGPVMLARQTRIGAEETAGELAERLATLAADATLAAIEEIASGAACWREQNAELATAAAKIERDEARLDWSEDADALERRVRAMAPTPGAFTLLDSEPLRILAARALQDPHDEVPGTVRRDAHQKLRIAAGAGWLVPEIVQRAGGRSLAIDAFLRGRPIPDGTRLSSC